MKRSIVESLHLPLLPGQNINTTMTSRTRHPLSRLRANPAAAGGGNDDGHCSAPQPVAGDCDWLKQLKTLHGRSVLFWNWNKTVSKLFRFSFISLCWRHNRHSANYFMVTTLCRHVAYTLYVSRSKRRRLFDVRSCHIRSLVRQ